MAAVTPRLRERFPDELAAVTDETEQQVLLDALDDADCRAILRATNDDALSASEVSEACGLPLSTTYRKLDALTEAGLVTEGTRVRRSGKHASEYVRNVDDVVVSVDPDGGLGVWVSRRDPNEELPWPPKRIR